MNAFSCVFECLNIVKKGYEVRNTIKHVVKGFISSHEDMCQKDFVLKETINQLDCSQKV